MWRVADRALELAIAEGATPVGVLRAGLMHLQRLHRVRLAVDEGPAAADAVKGRAAAGVLPAGGCVQPGGRVCGRPASLMAAMAGLAEAERACKRTGAPDAVLARNAMLALARRAAAARRKAAARDCVYWLYCMHYCRSPNLLSKLSN